MPSLTVAKGSCDEVNIGKPVRIAAAPALWNLTRVDTLAEPPRACRAAGGAKYLLTCLAREVRLKADTTLDIRPKAKVNQKGTREFISFVPFGFFVRFVVKDQ